MIEATPTPGGHMRLWRAGQRNALRIGSTLLVIIGTAANIIQVLTAGRPSILGILLVGSAAYIASLRVAFLAGRGQKNGVAAMRADELRTTRSVIEGTLGAYRPYNDERTIVFDIGESADADGVEEYHTTTPHHSPVVYWCLFEAFSRGPDQVLSWSEVDLHVTRTPEVQQEPQQAGVVRLQNEPVPRALIAFAPPRSKVVWTAKYSSPGYWDQLRQTGQLFEWIPPSTGPDEPTERRSPVQAITFVFRVPASLGTLEIYGVPAGVEVRPSAHGVNAETAVREYRCIIADISALPGPSDRLVDPVRLHFRLSRGSAK
jgi:hypothetical protein